MNSESSARGAFVAMFPGGFEVETKFHARDHPVVGEDPVARRSWVVAARRAQAGPVELRWVETSGGYFHVELDLGGVCVVESGSTAGGGVPELLTVASQRVASLREALARVRRVAPVATAPRPRARWRDDLQDALEQPVEEMQGAHGSWFLSTSRHLPVQLSVVVKQRSWFSREYGLVACVLRVDKKVAPFLRCESLSELAAKLEEIVDAIDELRGATRERD